MNIGSIPPAAPNQTSHPPLSAALVFGALAFLLSLLFYLEGRKATIADLCGDQVNILTLCVKKDNPHLLTEDNVVGRAANVDYYIPAFVNALRVFSGADRDYLRGLNLCLFLTSIFYTVGWWLLYSRWGNFWIAGSLALLTRGVLWPPGNELWGIGSLWTMLPRTLFVAGLPWVLWLWFAGRNCAWKRYFAALLLGIIGNVHPVSGASVIAAVVLAEVGWTLAETGRAGFALRRAAAFGGFCLLGLAPYIWIYLARQGGYGSASRAEFDEALRMRLGPTFLEPGRYLIRFCRIQWLLTLGVPWLGLLLLSREQRARNRSILYALMSFWNGCLLVTFGCFYLESLLRSLGSQANFAFQLVRGGKYLLVPSFIVLCIVCSGIAMGLKRRLPHGQALVAIGCILFCLSTIFSRLPVFDGIPVLGDDVCRELWPKILVGKKKTGSATRIDGVLHWIRENTPKEAKFIGPRWIRVGALRSVIHDWGGAGMLIEGNPEAFVQAARREKAFRDARASGDVKTLQLLAEWGADFWVTKDVIPSAEVAYLDGNWCVYRIPKPENGGF